MWSGVLLLAALQATAQVPDRVPVDVALVGDSVTGAAAAIIVRNPAGRDMILLSSQAVSDDLTSAVLKYKELYLESPAVTVKSEYPIARKAQPGSVAPPANKNSFITQLAAARPTPVAGVGEVRMMTMFVILRQPPPQPPSIPDPRSAGLPRLVAYLSSFTLPAALHAQTVGRAVHLSEPVAAIGEADAEPEYTLTKVAGVRLVGSQIVIADNGSSQLRFYDAKGRFQKSIGRYGSGPREFRFLKLVPNWNSDSLAVYDQRLNRVTLVSTDGVFGRSVQLAPRKGGPGLWAAQEVLGMDQKGHIVALLQAGATPTAQGLFRRPVTVFRTESVDSQSEELGTFKGNEFLFSVVDKRPVFSQLPFLQQFVSALGRDRLYYVEGPQSTVVDLAFGKFGRREQRLPFQSGRLARADYDGWVENELATVTAPPGAIEATRKFYNKLYASWETRPIAQIVIDDAGRIWIEEFTFSSSRRAAVYNPGFELLGLVTLPPGFTISCISGNMLAGVVKDSDGVERVEVRRVSGL